MTQRSAGRGVRGELRNLAIAELCAVDFIYAQAFPGFFRWADHQEFLTERQCLALSYGAAGVEAPMQRVPFGPFEVWSLLSGAPLDIDGLDEFAAHWRFRRLMPHASVVGLFGAPGRPELNPVEVGGAQCVVVRRGAFFEWRNAFARASHLPPPDLDSYATRMVEACLAASATAQRPALKTA